MEWSKALVNCLRLHQKKTQNKRWKARGGRQGQKSKTKRNGAAQAHGRAAEGCARAPAKVNLEEARPPEGRRRNDACLRCGGKRGLAVGERLGAGEDGAGAVRRAERGIGGPKRGFVLFFYGMLPGTGQAAAPAGREAWLGGVGGAFAGAACGGFGGGRRGNLRRRSGGADAGSGPGSGRFCGLT